VTTDFHELEVRSVRKETEDCLSFELSVPPHLREAYRYRAGQHLTFEIPWTDFTVSRCYSLSSAPECDEHMRLAVKRVEGGRVSNWMHEHLDVGMKLKVSVPEGRFVLDLDTRPAAPLFLVAAGSGITPIVSLCKSALHSTAREVILIYANRDRASTIYDEAIRQLEERFPDRLRVERHFDDVHGSVDAPRIASFLHHTDIAEFYLCGPEPFMELVERVLSEAGVHEELVYVERFVSPVDHDRREVRPMPIPSDAPETFSLWLHGRSRTVPYRGGKTLLECAQDAGLTPPHSCESGFCGSCMAQVKTGQVLMRTHEALSERDVARGVALLCQSVPARRAPLELDADSASFRTASAVKSSFSRRVSQLAAVAVFAFMIAGTLVLRWVE